jgi:hypothetical protein
MIEEEISCLCGQETWIPGDEEVIVRGYYSFITTQTKHTREPTQNKPKEVLEEEF